MGSNPEESPDHSKGVLPSDRQRPEDVLCPRWLDFQDPLRQSVAKAGTKGNTYSIPAIKKNKKQIVLSVMDRTV